MEVVNTITPDPDLRFIKGIGPKRCESLQRIGILTQRDLFYHFPRRYDDRSQFLSIDELTIGEFVSIKATVLKSSIKRIKRMPIVEVVFGDHTGTIKAVWFRQAYLSKSFAVDKDVVLYGKVELYRNQIQFTSPEFEILNDDQEELAHTGRIVPIYPMTEGLNQKAFRNIIHNLLATSLDSVTDHLPKSIVNQYKLPDLYQSLRDIHFPESMEDVERAKKRLIFDEFFSFQCALLLKKSEQLKEHDYVSIQFDDTLLQAYLDQLPFELTQAQISAIDEVRQDLTLKKPMNRLLQGDVGSGKTVVAAFLLLLIARQKYQCVFLVPTEVLASQHYKTITTFLKSFDLQIRLLTKSTEKEKKARLYAEVKQGKIDVLIGTHAVLQKDVQFQKLGLVIIDEQHKFGVNQRNQLLDQKTRPHQLVMSATPIPRSLALVLYANMDISTITELPKGRKPISTYWVHRKKQLDVFKHILKKVKEKEEQAYIIFPMIEETEKMDFAAAEQEYEKLKKGIFKEIRVGLVHGRIKADERDAVMKAFMHGEVDVLIATSVIEVGVDQPNATMMVIENSERFGLAQLHQLRGRIGRGKKESECFLFGDPSSDEGKMRLRLMTKSQDGFFIAEEDLKLRGPGDLWGTRQSGAPIFRLAHPVHHAAILNQAKFEAQSRIDNLSNNSWVYDYIKDHVQVYE